MEDEKESKLNNVIMYEAELSLTEGWKYETPYDNQTHYQWSINLTHLSLHHIRCPEK